MADPLVIFNYFFAVAVFASAYSIFFRNDNILWRFFEYSLSSVIVGYLGALMVKQLLAYGTDFVSGTFWYIIPFVFIILLYTRFTKGYSYMARWPTALLLGSLLGVITRASITSDLVNQVISMIQVPNNFNVIATQVMTIVTLVYFIFTFYGGKGADKKTPWNEILTMARLFIMLATGAAFANKYMSLMTSLINRISLFLFGWPF